MSGQVCIHQDQDTHTRCVRTSLHAPAPPPPTSRSMRLMLVSCTCCTTSLHLQGGGGVKDWGVQGFQCCCEGWDRWGVQVRVWGVGVWGCGVMVERGWARPRLARSGVQIVLASLVCGSNLEISACLLCLTPPPNHALGVRALRSCLNASSLYDATNACIEP